MILDLSAPPLLSDDDHARADWCRQLATVVDRLDPCPAKRVLDELVVEIAGTPVLTTAHVAIWAYVVTRSFTEVPDDAFPTLQVVAASMNTQRGVLIARKAAA